MGSNWDPNGIRMGPKWDPNGIQMFQLQQKVTYSRSYLVVTCDVNMLQMASKAPIAKKVNMLQMGSKWDSNGIQMYLLQQKVTYSRSYYYADDVKMLQMGSK